MTDPTQDAVQLVTGLVAHMRQIVGDGACYAMLHYGAVEEGKRLADQADGLDAALVRVDSLLRQRTAVLKNTSDHVSIKVAGSPWMGLGPEPMQGVVVGILEGVLTASRHERYRGTIAANGGDGVVVELQRDAS